MLEPDEYNSQFRAVAEAEDKVGNKGSSSDWFSYDRVDCTPAYFSTTQGDVHSNKDIRQPE